MVEDFFISHATENEEYVQKLAKGLEELGFSCWVSYRDIDPLEKWDEAIVKSLKGANYFILILSSFSASSKHVQREVRLADNLNLPLICIKLEDIPMSDSISYYFAGAEYIPAFEHSSIQETIAKIKKSLSRQKTPAQPTREGEPVVKNKFTPESTSINLGLGVKMDFVRVPAGEFWMGAAKEDEQAEPREKPRHLVYLDEYWIGKFPVTNAQYAVFVKEKRKIAPFNWLNGEMPKELANHPVVCVGWWDAKAFCEWASQVTQGNICLPSEAEWEKAARGQDGRIYPWGNTDPNPSLANFGGNIGNTTEVGRYPKGVSPYGALDMAGNVWELVADWYDEKYYHTYPEDQWPPNPSGPTSGTLRVLRGGSWSYDLDYSRVSFRFRYDSYHGNVDIGFRCVLSLQS